MLTIRTYLQFIRDWLSPTARAQRRQWQREWDEFENQMRDKRP